VPYIKQLLRNEYDSVLQELWERIVPRQAEDVKPITLDDIKGDINYCMTKLLVTLKAKYGERYHILSTIAGIARDVEQEFRDVHMRPYEDRKRKENGDVKPLNV